MFFAVFLFSELKISPDATFFAILLLGLTAGLLHAIEADHIAAVTTIVTERKKLFSAALVGGFWGIGHTITLLFFGLLAILLKMQIGPKTESLLETVVGAMLVILGLNALRKIFFNKPHTHTHLHAKDRLHEHNHEHDHGKGEVHSHNHLGSFNLRSLLIGMVHGLAGSAALTLLVASSISSPAVGLLFILIFGIGSIGGMMTASFLIGLPIHFTASRFSQINLGLRFTAGVFSLLLGLYVIYQHTAA